MSFPSKRQSAQGLWVLPLVLSVPAAGLVGCGTATPIPPVTSGPSWSLSKGQNDLSAPRGGTVPSGKYEASPAPQPQYVYRGGRDGNTGKAIAAPTAAPLQSAAPQPYAPGSLPIDPKRQQALATPGVQATAAYRPADPGGPGIPYQAPKLETVRKGESLSVMPGDTLTAIAQRHRVSVSEIMRVNGLVSPILQPGQRIKIPNV